MYALWYDSSKQEKTFWFSWTLGFPCVPRHPHAPVFFLFPNEGVWQSAGPVILWALTNPKDQLSAMKWPWVNFREISQEKGLNTPLWEQCGERNPGRVMLAASPGVNPMATWCSKCGQQDPRYVPDTSVRITEAEMRAFHRFLESCIRLECMAKKGTMRATMAFFHVHLLFSLILRGIMV